MLKKIEKSAKNKEDALKLAAEEFGVAPEELSYTVERETGKGLMGLLLGRKKKKLKNRRSNARRQMKRRMEKIRMRPRPSRLRETLRPMREKERKNRQKRLKNLQSRRIIKRTPNRANNSRPNSREEIAR